MIDRKNTAKSSSILILWTVTVLFIAVISVITGCAKKPSSDVRIVLTTLDGADVSESDAVFPTFVSKDETFQKKLDKLNKEVEKVRKNYEERRQKDKQFIVHTFVGSEESVPQCTLFWYEEHSLLGDDYNLMTLAYNKKTGELLTSKEALDSLQIDGVTLSTNVGKLFKELHPDLELKGTEMQGFETDESGAVTRVYMKLVAEKMPDGEEAGNEGVGEQKDLEETDEEIDLEEIHFYSYDPSLHTLIPLAELGYEIP